MLSMTNLTLDRTMEIVYRINLYTISKHNDDMLVVHVGKRYLKLKRSQSRCVIGFVSVATGDIFYSSSAKRPSGNVHSPTNGDEGLCYHPSGLVSVIRNHPERKHRA